MKSLKNIVATLTTLAALNSNAQIKDSASKLTFALGGEIATTSVKSHRTGTPIGDYYGLDGDSIGRNMSIAQNYANLTADISSGKFSANLNTGGYIGGEYQTPFTLSKGASLGNLNGSVSRDSTYGKFTALSGITYGSTQGNTSSHIHENNIAVQPINHANQVPYSIHRLGELTRQQNMSTEQFIDTIKGKSIFGVQAGAYKETPSQENPYLGVNSTVEFYNKKGERDTKLYASFLGNNQKQYFNIQAEFANNLRVSGVTIHEDEYAYGISIDKTYYILPKNTSLSLTMRAEAGHNTTNGDFVLGAMQCNYKINDDIKVFAYGQGGMQNISDVGAQQSLMGGIGITAHLK